MSELLFPMRLDPKFQPMILVLRAYREKVQKAGGGVPVAFCVERNNGYKYRYDINVLPGDEEAARLLERLIKSVLWVVGGFRVYFGGDDKLGRKLQAAFQKGALRDFDVNFMAQVYDHEFEFIVTTLKDVPESVSSSIAVGGNLDGCRIGFDAGGSDRKVSAVVNGEVIYSEEVVWLPKVTADPQYHLDGIIDSFKRAASKMPRVDAIGVSSAGIYINNEVRVASLFLKVPHELFESKVRNIYKEAAKAIGDVPLEVCNDGDVTALAGAMQLKDNNVLGIAMGTSEAVGYINNEGNINGWLSELAFVPVDYSKEAMVDEWSGDYGCGVKYFSQDGAIKLAEAGGVKFDANLTPAEKLKVIQQMMKDNDPLAKEIYETIGVYLGYTLPYYAEFYNIKYLLLLGRVTSGQGGDIIIEKANEVLAKAFPEFKILITTPDEYTRRVGQSIAAASLPKSRA